MNKNDLKKQLMLQKTMANFHHYCAGHLYYGFAVDGQQYQFPIATVEHEGTILSPVDGNELKVCQLSDDLGTTPFNAADKAVLFWRWIDKAIDAGKLKTLVIPEPPAPPAPPEDRIIREGEGPRPPR